MKGLFIPGITAEMFRNGCLESIEALMAKGEIYDIEYYPKAENEKEDVLDKIRTEIAEEKEHAYADFERYKVEYLGQDVEDALDSLPQDDYRYGMERCIEIINKYKTESEVEE